MREEAEIQIEKLTTGAAYAKIETLNPNSEEFESRIYSSPNKAIIGAKDIAKKLNYKVVSIRCWDRMNATETIIYP